MVFKGSSMVNHQNIRTAGRKERRGGVERQIKLFFEVFLSLEFRNCRLEGEVWMYVVGGWTSPKLV